MSKQKAIEIIGQIKCKADLMLCETRKGSTEARRLWHEINQLGDKAIAELSKPTCSTCGGTKKVKAPLLDPKKDYTPFELDCPDCDSIFTGGFVGCKTPPNTQLEINEYIEPEAQEPDNPADVPKAPNRGPVE